MILVASGAGYAVFAWLGNRASRLPSNSKLLEWNLVLVFRGLGAGVAAAVFLFFDFWWPEIQTGIAAITGIMAMSTAAAYIRDFKFGDGGSDRFVTLILGLTVIAWVGFCTGIVYALILGEFDSFATAAVLLLLGTLAVGFAAFAARALAHGRPVQVEGHWGGLGGGLGGWRISQPMIFLVLTIIFAGSTATVLIKAGPEPPEVTSGDAEPSADDTTNPGNGAQQNVSAGADVSDDSTTEPSADQPQT